MNKTITTITLALVLTFGATFANAGIIIGDKADTNKGSDTCSNRNGIIIGDAPTGGIIIGDLMAPGILVSDLVSGIAGIIIGDTRTSAPAPCKTKNGIIIGDAPTGGIIIGD